ncbi:MAG TPA: hypothetical protein DD640_10775 [Clostridiales bacterium]|nr:hypothetical protein [Clostridiales bacterium]
MDFENFSFNETDVRMAEKLRDFLPKKIFDAHTHPYDASFLPGMYNPASDIMCQPRLTYGEYVKYQGAAFPRAETVRINMITMPDAAMTDRANGLRSASVRFLREQLDQFPGNVGEVFVLPDDTDDEIASLLVHPAIRGFKCYHSAARAKPTWQCAIGEYLPESAWRTASERDLSITLHMVRDHSLADPVNLDYIKKMSRKYPRATLILAHAARGFAAWTTVTAVAKLADCENVWFDLSAVCESPAMFAIMKHCGTRRVMWGSDFPISMARGKAISLGDSFYWIYKQDLERFSSATPLHANLIGIENLMATEQACKMLDLDRTQVEDLFYNNAMRLFGLRD